MKKKNLVHYKNVHIETDVYSKGENIKVEISTFFYHDPICEFWVPRSCIEKIGNALCVPTAIIKSRALRDFGLTFDHHSAGLLMNPLT